MFFFQLTVHICNCGEEVAIKLHSSETLDSLLESPQFLLKTNHG